MRSPELRRTAALVAVAGCSLFLLVVWISIPWVSGDTPFVFDGSNALLTCLSAHDWNACGYTGELNEWGLMSPIGYWPLLQHIPDVLSIELGVTSHPARARVLVTLGIAGVVACVALARPVLARFGQSAWFWGFFFVILGSPLVAYARQTFGETFAAGLLVSLVAAAALQVRGPVMALAAFGAAITKETSYPFVIAFGVLALVLARRRTGRPIRPQLVWGGAGLALAIALASLLNVVRFGSALNTNYLNVDFRTPGIARKLEYAAALLVSPNGGIFVFWLSASLLVAAACVAPFVKRRGLDVRPAIVVILVAIGLDVGLASWWTPFGWTGYGPRLSLPWLPALVLVAVIAYGDVLADLTRRLVTPVWGLAGVFLVALALTLPHIGEMWRPNSTAGFFRQETNCATPWNGSVASWHECQHNLLWADRPVGLYALHGLKTPGGVLTAFAVALGLLGSLVLLRDDLVARGALEHE